MLFMTFSFLQVTGSESDINSNFKKPDISLFEFLKSKFITLRLQRLNIVSDIFCNILIEFLLKSLPVLIIVCFTLCLISVSQDVCPPPVEPSLPDAGPGPVLLLLCDCGSCYVPEQVFDCTVQCLGCLQQSASRWVQHADEDRASGKDTFKDHNHDPGVCVSS